MPCNRTLKRDVDRIHHPTEGLLRNVLQAVTLLFVWTDRNRHIFDQRSATPTILAVSVIHTPFSAHVRYNRRQFYEQDEQIRLAKVLEQLATQASFGGVSEVEDHGCGYDTGKWK